MIASLSPFTHRVAVLFDIQNIEINEDWGCVMKLDYARLLGRIQDHGNSPRRLEEAIAYSQSSRLTVAKQLFLERGLGLQVKRTQKNSDSHIYADAVICALNHVKVIVFVGGDKDVMPFFPIFRTHLVKVEVWSWRRKTSQELIDAADEFIPLTTDLILSKSAIMAATQAEPEMPLSA